MKKFLILILSLFLGLSAFAEDGSALWLRYDSVPSNPDDISISLSGVKPSDPTIIIAQEELCNAGVKGQVMLRLIEAEQPSESFELSLTANKALITSTSPVGLLYGVYSLIRRDAMGRKATLVKESPAYRLRVLNHWDNPDGTVERGYAGRSLWQWDSLPGVISPRYAQYARACASVGINTVVLNNVNAKPQMLTSEVIEKAKALADVFRPYGLRVALSINFASPKVIGGHATADPLDENVQKWWADKVEEIYALIPDFAGFLVKANSEGEPGPGDYGRTHAEGANMLARAVEPHGGVIMWRAFVYNPSSPDRAMQAYEEFVPLDSLFADNVIIQIKNGPVDFQPREPFSPLFGAMPQTQQMVEFQITQEYLGGSNHLVYLAPLFKECLDADTHRMEGTVGKITSTPHHGVSAIAGVANIGDDANWCGHDFAQANWYAFGRLAWNPSLSSEQIAREWLTQTFSAAPEFVDPVTEMMLSSREAAVNYMQPIGLHHIFAGNHHYGPEPWYAPEGIRVDWTPAYYHRADAEGVGFDRTIASGTGATGQYADQVAQVFEDNCPLEYLLWFHRVGWGDVLPSGKTLWAEMCDHYTSGLESARAFQKTWDSVRPYVDPERFAAVQDKLKIQTHDAQWWKDACLLYFQSINGLDFPADMERPVYSLDALKQVQIPLGLYGCPTRDMLP